MKKVVITFGLLSGAVSAAMMSATMPFAEAIGFDRMLVVGYTAIVISFLFVYFGIRSYRDNVLGGLISFGKGFQAGILITLISCFVYVAAWLVVNYTLIPDFADKYSAYLVEDQRAQGASQAEIDTVVAQGEQMKEMLANPLINAAVAFTEPFPVGLLISVISAAVLKKKPEAS
jgi:Protein of unknown function (DUF4199)